MKYKILFCVVVCMFLVACTSEDAQEDTKTLLQQGQKQVSQKEDLPTMNPDGMEMWAGPNFVQPDSVDVYLGFANAEDSETWNYKESYFMTEEPGNEYEQGAFCRIFKTAEGYNFIYGGSFSGDNYDYPYQGVLYKKLDQDFEEVQGPTKFSDNGGDLAIDSDEDYYYLLGGGPPYQGHDKSWKITKYDKEFNVVKETRIGLSLGHMTNDQMIRVVNEQIFVSSLYVPETEEITLHADEKTYTHLWILDKNLDYVSDKILNESYNINGETMIYYEGKYAHISSDHYANATLLAMIYDSNWNYIETKEIQDNAHWSMGALYHDGLIYVAYEGTNINDSNVFVNIYDTEWNLIEQIKVTNVAETIVGPNGKPVPNYPMYAGNRPWIQIYDNLMLVSYDITRDMVGANAQLSLICMLSVYERE